MSIKRVNQKQGEYMKQQQRVNNQIRTALGEWRIIVNEVKAGLVGLEGSHG